MSRSEYLRDAQANCITNEQAKVTLEIINASYLDSDGNPQILYVVNDNADLEARIEAGALNGGRVVTFCKCKFVANPIAISPDSIPEYSLKIQNIGETLLRHFRNAAKEGTQTRVNVRYYLPSRALLGPEAETEFLVADHISHSTSGSMIEVKFKVLSFLNDYVPRQRHEAA